MFKITARGIPEVKAFLQSLPNNVKSVVAGAFAEYLVGDASHGLKNEPSYKYVNRYAGFPNIGYTTTTGRFVPGYVSAKQHGYVMASITDGTMKPGQNNRTGGLSGAWNYKAQGSNYIITNDNPAAQFVVGGRQTRMHQLIGWRTTTQTIADNMAGAMRHAIAALNKWMREHSKKK